VQDKKFLDSYDYAPILSERGKAWKMVIHYAKGEITVSFVNEFEGWLALEGKSRDRVKVIDVLDSEKFSWQWSVEIVNGGDKKGKEEEEKENRAEKENKAEKENRAEKEEGGRLIISPR